MGSGCCHEDEHVPLPAVPQPPSRGFATFPNSPAAPTTCAYCGRCVDPSLMDGHQETCRVQYRQRMGVVGSAAERSRPPVAPAPVMPKREHSSSADNFSTGEVAHPCVVCLERERSVAFVPCGHLSLCTECASQLSECPICRAPRTGLLKVDMAVTKLCICKHCKQLIGPNFFDGHQEVCALRMREQAEQAGGSRPRSGKADKAQQELCVGCKTAPRAVALVPCGHFLLCAACADKALTCPMCLRDITGSLPMFT